MEVYKLLLGLVYIIWTVVSIIHFIRLRIGKTKGFNGTLFTFMLIWMIIHAIGIGVGIIYLLETYLSFEWLFYKIELWK